MQSASGGTPYEKDQVKCFPLQQPELRTRSQKGSERHSSAGTGCAATDGDRQRETGCTGSMHSACCVLTDTSHGISNQPRPLEYFCVKRIPWCPSYTNLGPRKDQEQIQEEMSAL